MDKLWFKARRAISVLLVFAMLASITPAQVFAEEAQPSDVDTSVSTMSVDEEAAQKAAEEAAAAEAAQKAAEEAAAAEAAQKAAEEAAAAEAAQKAAEEAAAAEAAQKAAEEAAAAEAAQKAAEETVDETVDETTTEGSVAEGAPAETPAQPETTAPEEEAPAMVGYTVKYLDKATEEGVAEETAGEAAVGETIAIEAPEVEGYTLCADQPTELVLAADAENVATVYYEVAMPAQTLTATAADGATVTIDAPEGALPAGTTVQITIMDTVPEVEGVEFTEAIAYDVTLWNNGAEVQPAVPVNVTLSNVPLDAAPEDMEVYHKADDGTVDKGDVQGDKSADFNLNSFSPFIAGTTSQEDAELANDLGVATYGLDDSNSRKAWQEIELEVGETYSLGSGWDAYVADEDIAEVDYFLGRWYVKAKNKGETTVTVKHAYGSDDHYRLTVTDSSSQPTGNTKAYFYILKPGKDEDSNDNNDWIYVGTGEISLDGLVMFDVPSGDKTIKTSYQGDKVVTYPADATIKDAIKKAYTDQNWDEIKDISYQPYKITYVSGANGTSETGMCYHVDMTVSFETDTTATYTFMVDDPTDLYEGFVTKEDGELEKGQQVTEAMIPEMEESKTDAQGNQYVFKGWYLNEELTQVATFPYTLTSRVIFYGAYEKQATYTIKYQAQDNTGYVSLASETVVKGEDAVGSTATASDGYYFVKWVDADGKQVSTDKTFAPQNVQADATYYAVFAKKADLTITIVDKEAVYDGSEKSGYGYMASGEGASDVDGLKEGHSIATVTYNPAKGTNVGEYTNGDTNAQVVVIETGTSIVVTDQYNVIVNPGKLTIKGKVTYNWNTTDTVTIDGVAAEPPTNDGKYALNQTVTAYSYGDPNKQPTRTGYTFKGWATSADATTAVTSAPMEATGLTFYAVWEANAVNVVIEYYADGVKRTNWKTESGEAFQYQVDNKKYGDNLTIQIGGAASDLNIPAVGLSNGTNYIIEEIVFGDETSPVFELNESNYVNPSCNVTKQLTGNVTIRVYYTKDHGDMKDGTPDKYQAKATFLIVGPNGVWKNHNGSEYTVIKTAPFNDQGAWDVSGKAQITEADLDTVVPNTGYSSEIEYWTCSKTTIKDHYDSPLDYENGQVAYNDTITFKANLKKDTCTVEYKIENGYAIVQSPSYVASSASGSIKPQYGQVVRIDFYIDEGYTIDFDDLEQYVTKAPDGYEKDGFSVRTDVTYVDGEPVETKYVEFKVTLGSDVFGDYKIEIRAVPDTNMPHDLIIRQYNLVTDEDVDTYKDWMSAPDSSIDPLTIGQKVRADETKTFYYGGEVSVDILSGDENPGYEYYGYAELIRNTETASDFTQNTDGTQLTSVLNQVNTVEITVYYVEKDPVTINYVADANGSVSNASDTVKPVTGNPAGSTATANDGYVFVNWTDESGSVVSTNANFVPGKSADGVYVAQTYTAHFAVRSDYTYTVRYLEDGTARQLADPKTVDGQTLGATVTETAIDIGGFTLTSDKNPQSITIGTGENVITFYYKEVGPAVEPTPEPTETPTVLIVPPTTPAGGGTTTTTTTEEEEVTEEPAEEEVIEEEETPLAEEPAEEETIGEEETPLAGGNAAWALLNLILTILTVLGSILLLIGYLGKKRKEEEDETTGETTTEYEVKKHGFWRVASLIPAIAAVIAFILTEDMRLPMIFVDRWTLLMVIIAVIQIVVAVLCIKEKQEPDEDDAATA